ncbi:8402_t:CDS:2 [Paraglomus occultum]|uniref:8402_t:CDS:1 n=1 Tax=Paraglomus occultum TaxID=144539 RepID=A0A9N9BJT4_9GLOM|nr:8402_t:CDS:2 [Paraglomus occultum]
MTTETPYTPLLDFDPNTPYHTFIRNLRLLRTGQVVVGFNVLLDTTRVVFYGPPDAQKRGKVRGKVKLELAGRMNVKEILITLTGEYHIPTSPSISCQIFSTCILLVHKRTLAPGTQEFPFEFVLPGDLPESFGCDLMQCEYFIEAELKPRDELHSRENKLKERMDLVIERALIENDEYVKYGLESVRYVGSMVDVLDYEFLVPKILPTSNNELKFHARWDGLLVDSVRFWLIQSEHIKSALFDYSPAFNIHSLPTSSTSHSFDELTHKIIAGPYLFNLPRNQLLKLQCRPMVYQLPITEPFVPDFYSLGFEITHQLIVSIQMADKKQAKIEFGIPVRFHSIVANDNMVPSPCNVHVNVYGALLYYGHTFYRGKTADEIQQEYLDRMKKKQINRLRRRRFIIPRHQSDEAMTKFEDRIGNANYTYIPPSITSNVDKTDIDSIETEQLVPVTGFCTDTVRSASTTKHSSATSTATTITPSHNTKYNDKQNTSIFSNINKSKFATTSSRTYSIASKLGSLLNQKNHGSQVVKGCNATDGDPVKYSPGVIETLALRAGVSGNWQVGSVYV